MEPWLTIAIALLTFLLGVLATMAGLLWRQNEREKDALWQRIERLEKLLIDLIQRA